MSYLNGKKSAPEIFFENFTYKIFSVRTSKFCNKNLGSPGFFHVNSFVFQTRAILARFKIWLLQDRAFHMRKSCPLLLSRACNLFLRFRIQQSIQGQHVNFFRIGVGDKLLTSQLTNLHLLLCFTSLKLLTFHGKRENWLKLKPYQNLIILGSLGKISFTSLWR